MAYQQDTKQNIVSIYKKYGFELEEESEDYLVFTLQDTVYPGVDIISQDSTLINHLQNKYEAIGMSVNIVQSLHLEDIDKNLYRRFLRPKLGKIRLLKQYDDYIKKSQEPYKNNTQTISQYHYIEADYLHECQFKPIRENHGLVADIINLINEKGPKLIIVEAPAGFGKTSTSYEIIRQLSSTEDDRRPFLMELERERQANTFHYIMVSQMERTFGGIIRESIVTDNIKKGRIPVIIDGFDEYLGNDIDNGRSVLVSENGNTRIIDSILSTIADLLVEDSKIVLTTRKTALFSTEEFQDWVEHQKANNRRCFSVDRFQILDSRPENWLTKEQMDLLPSPFIHLTNPVLLAFLKYTDTLSSNHTVTAPSLINKFFTSIYVRERERQDISLTNEEQDKILRMIASYFVYYDITADKRTNVKDAILELNTNIISRRRDDKTTEELLNRLVNHAMLDRKIDGLIGFLNDFIFGYFLSRAIEENDTNVLGIPVILSAPYIERVIDTAKYLSDSQKANIGRTLLAMREIDSYQRFEIERLLIGVIRTNYTNLYFENQKYLNFKFQNDSKISDSHFIDCSFEGDDINMENFENTVFINCDFSRICITGEGEKNYFYKCTGIEEFPDITSETILSYDLDTTEEEELNQRILRLYKRTGGQTPRIYHISRIIRELSGKFQRKEILKQINKLDKKKYIYVDGNISWILQLGTEYLRNGN